MEIWQLAKAGLHVTVESKLAFPLNDGWWQMFSVL
jgi:hypothetical protein